MTKNQCVYCGQEVSQFANGSTVCTSPANISEPDTVGNKHHVFRDLDKESERVRQMMRDGDTEGLAAYANAGNRARASEIIRKRYAITPERIAEAKVELAKDDASAAQQSVGNNWTAEDYRRAADIYDVAEDIIRRVVSSTLKLAYIRQVSVLDNCPEEAIFVADGLAIALGEETGCNDPEDLTAENCELLFVEKELRELLNRALAARG